MALKNFVRSKGISVDKEMNRFAEATESSWNEAIKEILDEVNQQMF